MSSLAIALTFLLPALSLLNLLCCAGVILGALVGPYLYTSQNQAPISARQAAAMGALAGALGGLWSLLAMLLLYELGIDLAAEARRILRELEESGVWGFAGSLEVLTAGARILALSGLLNILWGALFGALGGLIGGSIWGERYAVRGS
ncbi:MAG: hypothetical protein N2561_10040 [Bacteroidetes bacterium]|nr:hypothetical protein [Rhodothermia bacterium]MCS7155272.1 hypothetical protein [Bacteroidota bacterium]MCX7907857.1 hypothetical protein [Bacteroidota bacterium]MDW8138676.1 hypothetical protein [Bacteroidota bacterium]MDW8284738.1 hypothetical protein [Bacteroidota bacterium]